MLVKMKSGFSRYPEGAGQQVGFQFKPGQNQAPVAQSCIMS
jgi:hypothetical protein